MIAAEMGPLQKYYFSMLGMVLVGLFAGAVGPGPLQVAAVVALLGVAGFMVFIRCPKCRTRLSGMGDSPGIHGLPGRRCPKCGANLGRTLG